MQVPYLFLDYTLPTGPYPIVRHCSYYAPSYRAEQIDYGADVFLDGAKVAWFSTMEEACDYITKKADAAKPWWSRTATNEEV